MLYLFTKYDVYFAMIFCLHLAYVCSTLGWVTLIVHTYACLLSYIILDFMRLKIGVIVL